MKAPVTQPDLFLTVIGDAPFREALDLMSVPVVSLACLLYTSDAAD